MTTATVPAVRRSVTVAAPTERVFEVFVGAPTAWWPAGHHVLDAELAEVVLERHVGGRWYERSVDGGTHDWGRVLAYQPPRLLRLAWHLNGNWRFDPDPRRASEVEVRFTPVAGGTRVDLEHRYLERHGAAGTRIADSVAGPNGWAGILSGFGRVAAGR